MKQTTLHLSLTLLVDKESDFWQVKNSISHLSLKLLVDNKLFDKWNSLLGTRCWQVIRPTLHILWNSLLTIRVTFWQVKQSSYNSLLTSDTVYFAYTLKLLVDDKSNFLTIKTVFLQLVADKWYGLLGITLKLLFDNKSNFLTSETIYFAFTLKLLVDNKSNFLTSETVYFAFTLKLLVMLGDATVYRAIITLKLLVYKWEPFLDNVLSRSRPVREWELGDGHPWNKYQISLRCGSITLADYLLLSTLFLVLSRH